MEPYLKLELHTLLDLLAMQTIRYTRMIAVGIFSGPGYSECKSAINNLQTAISHKMKQGKPANPGGLFAGAGN